MDVSSVSSLDESSVPGDEEQGHRTLPSSQIPPVSSADGAFARERPVNAPSRAQKEGDDDDVSQVMQNFLADFLEMQHGDTSAKTPQNISRHSTTTVGGPHQESIFESEYDLTDERLRYVFEVFDQDGDGLIDYESLRQGLQFQSSSSKSSSVTTLDDEAFNQLTSYLDIDKSGDISFEEFSEGVRLMILRSLLRRTDNNKEKFMTEVLDYDAQRLQRRVINDDKFSFKLSTSVIPMSPNDFYFQDRPSWVSVRWVNIHDVHSRVLDRVGVKYRLHPLAIDDASDPGSHRPKAEAYSSHYYLMVPLFQLESLDIKSKYFREKRETNWNQCGGFFSRLRRGSMPQDVDELHGPRMGRIVNHTASIFVSLPRDNTIITYFKEEHDPAFEDVSSAPPSRLWKRTEKDLTKSYSKLRQYGGQYLCYSLLNEAVGTIGPIIINVSKEIKREKDRLQSTHYKDLMFIHELGSQLRRMSRKLKPFVRLLQHVIEDEQIAPGPTVFLRDVLDNLENHDEELKQLIRDCANVDSDAEKFQQRQVDSTLYTLTVISAVFLPAQFLTGVWGMNFEYMPELKAQYGYLMFWLLSISLMSCTLLFLNCGRFRA